MTLTPKTRNGRSLLFLATIMIAATLLAPNGSALALDQSAVISTVANDFSSGAHAVVDVDLPRTAYTQLAPTGSDITVVARGGFFYIMERTGSQSITKYSIDAPDTPIWQYSTDEAGDTNSNAHDLIFASDDKAYLLRFGSDKAWIVNPSATTEAAFKIGELDLSAYRASDGSVANMHSGIIVNGELYIAMQRLHGTTWAPETAYVAVFNTLTDTEINTGGGGLGNGIPMMIENLGNIQYLAANDTIYVQGSGNYFGVAGYSSGIETINPNTYATALLLDDDQGGATPNPFGYILGMSIVSPTKGYFVGYAGWGDNTLYAFDPSNPPPAGVATEVDPYLKNKNIAGMESGTYIDKNGMLWVCNQTDAEVVIIDTATDVIDDIIDTILNPSRIAFVTGVFGGGVLAAVLGDSSSSSCFITAAGNSAVGYSGLFLAAVAIGSVFLAGIRRRTYKKRA